MCVSPPAQATQPRATVRDADRPPPGVAGGPTRCGCSGASRLASSPAS